MNVASAINTPGTPNANEGPGRMPMVANHRATGPNVELNIFGSNSSGVSSVEKAAPKLIEK